MDSQERDQRAIDGFSERGEVLYDADEKDERISFRNEKKQKRLEKDIRKSPLTIDEAP